VIPYTRPQVDEPVSTIFSERTIACHAREQEDEAGRETIKMLKLIHVAITSARATGEGVPFWKTFRILEVSRFLVPGGQRVIKRGLGLGAFCVLRECTS
jgi:hypothetical protein